ncbi:MAG: DUF480 domain-containing protein, partial [Acidobacteriota bacterium]|nr:DUF480 domain-containing protein [Acidobacteriota bacterium]
QTLGEIKGRSERLYAFADLDEVETVVQKLIHREEGGMVQKLAAAPGLKEPRYAQLLGGPIDPSVVYTPAAVSTGANDRIAALEFDVIQLREEVAELRRRLEAVL